METIEEIRQRNLRALLEEGLSQAEIGRAMNKSAKQVSQWFGKGSARAMSSATARQLETAVGKPRGWLDNLNDSNSTGNRETESHSQTLDPDILHEAITLIVFDEEAAGAYPPRTYSRRLAELYARVAADGGKLTDPHSDEFENEVHARGSQHVATPVPTIRRRTNRNG